MKFKRVTFISFIALLFTLSYGTAGYSLLEGWQLVDSLYMTIITLTTVGYGEVYPLHQYGKVFTISIILLGVVTVGYLVSGLTKFLLEGELEYYFGRKRMTKQIEKVKGHYIVCGFGRMGAIICDELNRIGVPFIVIDSDQKSFEEAGYKGYPSINGNATEEDLLIKAGILKAKGIVCVVDSDAENIFIAMTAKALNKEVYIVARSSEEKVEKKLKTAGADKVISPYTIGGMAMFNAIVKPHVMEFIELLASSRDLDLKLEDVVLEDQSSLVGKSLRQSGIREKFGLTIVAVQKPNGQMAFNPRPDVKFEEGDRLIALGSEKGLDRLAMIASRG